MNADPGPTTAASGLVVVAVLVDVFVAVGAGVLAFDPHAATPNKATAAKICLVIIFLPFSNCKTANFVESFRTEVP
jgi:hypothetical protein